MIDSDDYGDGDDDNKGGASPRYSCSVPSQRVPSRRITCLLPLKITRKIFQQPSLQTVG